MSNALTVSPALRRTARELGITPDHPAITYLAGLSTRASRASMLGAVRRVAVFLGCAPAEIRWHDLTHAQIVLFRTWLGERFAPATANHTLSAVRGVLRSFARAGQITRDQVATVMDVPPVRGSRVVRGRSLTRDELAKLFGVCAGKGVVGARDVAILALIYGCGLRRSELARLTVDDVKADVLLIHGKGNKEREVPVPPDALGALRRWLDARGRDPGPIFLRAHRGARARSLHPDRGRLSGSGLYHVLCRLAREAGVPPFAPHDLRRTYIGDLLDLGVDVVTVAALVGHCSVAMTQRYDRRPERARRAAAAKLVLPLAG